MKKYSLLALLLAIFTLPAALLAQAPPAAAPSASIHGHANDELGINIKNGEVRLTQDLGTEVSKRKYAYTFKVDDSGNFKGTDIAPGTYLVNLFSGGESVDFNENQVLKANTDTVENFDLSRAEYIAKATPERKKQIEEYKKKNAETMAANSKIGNLNATLKSVRDDLATAHPNFDQDTQQMQAAVSAKPDEAILYFTLGNVYVSAGDAAAADARAQHKSVQSDDTIVKKYQDGIDAYKKGIDLNDAAIAAKKKANPADSATAWNSVGTSEAKIGKSDLAQAAFESAVKINPAGAGMYYGNEAAILFNAGQGDVALVAAQKAIAADPTKADPYFILGQTLIQKATVDKAGKIVAPAGCVEAYQKYIELAPDGKYVPTVKEILASMGQTVNTKYKAPGKK